MQCLRRPTAIGGGDEWGFENQSTGYDCGKNERPLGAVVRGAGNGNSTEGARASNGAGLVIATHMHGPVVVRNFEIANEICEHVLRGKSFEVTHPDGIRAVALSRKLRESRLAELDS